MNQGDYWLSRITSREDINWQELVRLGGLDPYRQHQELCKLFDLPSKEQKNDKTSTPFLFRAERITPESAVGYAHPKLVGLPVFYVLSNQKPADRTGLWHVDTHENEYRPDLREGDRLAFKLRANPVMTRKTEQGRRHDVVMDAKRRMDWRNLPPNNARHSHNWRMTPAAAGCLAAPKTWAVNLTLQPCVWMVMTRGVSVTERKSSCPRSISRAFFR